jgi:hypothetical protein
MPLLQQLPLLTQLVIDFPCELLQRNRRHPANQATGRIAMALSHETNDLSPIGHQAGRTAEWPK